MRWKAGERPRKNWTNCAACWMSTKGERDDELRALDFAGADEGARMDPAAFHLAGRGAGSVVCGRDGSLPKRGGTVRAGCRYAGTDDGFSGDYLRVAATRNHSGRAVRGARFFAVGWEGGTTRRRRSSLRRPGRCISKRATDCHALVRGVVVSRCLDSKLENRGRFALDRKNAQERDQADRAGAARKVQGSATEDGARSGHPVLRMPPPGCPGGSWMVPASSSAANESADRHGRATDRSGDRARAGAHSPAGLLREPLPDRCRNASLLSPGRLVGEPAGTRGARELLRRRSDFHLRRCGRLRARPHADGRMADGSSLDDGGESQPAGGTCRPASRIEWTRSYREDTYGGTGSELCLLDRSAAGRECISGRGARVLGDQLLGKRAARRQ